MKSYRNNPLRVVTFAIAILSLVAISSCGNSAEPKMPSRLKFTPDELMNKIKGGWAGQAIGVTYGGPTEFRYQERMMADDEQVPWGDADQVLTTRRGLLRYDFI